MTTKKKILVYWYYHRKDLLTPFIKLSDQFEWHFILYRSKAEETQLDFPFSIHYWDDYYSPYNLLNDLKPKAVVLMELSNIYALSLNIASKYLGITTFILEHGLKLNYDYYINNQLKVKSSNTILNNEISKISFTRKLQTLMFYFRCLKIRNFSNAFILFKYLKNILLIKTDKSIAEYKFNLRNADKYLLFSKQNLAYYQERDGIQPKDAIFFGNPYLDDLANISISKNKNEEGYYLLLDDGLLESFGISTKEKNTFLENLNNVAIEKKVALYVKLHPADYGRKDLFSNENIRYLDHVEPKELFKNAIAIFALSSTMALPLIPKGEVFLFRILNNEIQEELERWNVPFLDFYSFESREVNPLNVQMNKQDAHNFIDQFLYINDGQAVRRLGKILNNYTNN